MYKKTLFTVLFALLLSVPASAQIRVLFDGAHGETAGNADWIVDADTSTQYWDNYQCNPGGNHHSAQQIPTPAQSGITLSTPETYWDGGISAWAMDLVKDGLQTSGRDWTIEQYPVGAPEFSYGNAGNPQDLSNYDVLILCEPNVMFTANEITAILDFVANGGGLFMVADHETSDRNCSNGSGNEPHDSPRILNTLMGTNITTSPSQSILNQTTGSMDYWDPADPSNDFGVFGIWFYENYNDSSADGANKAFDWFNEAVNNNVTTDLSDPIIYGPFSDATHTDGTGGLGFFGSTQIGISVDPTMGNTTAKAHVWRNAVADPDKTPNSNNVVQYVTFASATYGAGRVVAIGDSSPADDGTGEGTLYDGWDKATGGVANHIIHLNATLWLANPTPDTTEPVISAVAANPSDCSAEITWETDENATSRVDWGTSLALGTTETVSGYRKTHAVTLPGLLPNQTYYYEVTSVDPSLNSASTDNDYSFSTTATSPINITSGPSAGSIDHQSAVIAWTTDKVGTSVVHYGENPSCTGTTVSVPDLVTSHAVTLTGLNAETTYCYSVESVDTCGTPDASATDTFTTLAVPPQINISGWQLVNNQNASFTYTFPANTFLPANGYIVVGRNSDQATFEVEWGPLDPAVVYHNSANTLVINSSNYDYSLLDNLSAVVDGPTVASGGGDSVHRTDMCGNPSLAGSWGIRADTSGDPGAGAPAACGAGVVILEMTDGTAFENEYIEIYYDAGSPTPDTDPPVLSSLAVTPGDCTATLTWTTDEDSDSEVNYGVDPDLNLSDSDAVLVQGHSLVLTGLTPNTNYVWEARSTDGSGNTSAYSSGPGFTTTNNGPVQSGITAGSITTTTAQITWTTNESASRSVDFGPTISYGTTLGTGSGTSHSVDLEGLDPSTLYHYRVRNTDSCGIETVSADFTFTTLDPDVTPPAAITDLTADPTGTDTISLAWTAVGDDGNTGTATAYYVRMAPWPILTQADWDAATVVVQSLTPLAAGGSESLDVTGLNTNESWHFAVRAEDEEPNLGALGNSPGATTPSSLGDPCTTHLVLSEVQTRGASDHNDEFIEIYNPTDSSVSLNGLSLQYKSSSGTTYAVHALANVSLASGEYYLVARAEYTGGTTPDETQSAFLMGASGGHVFLVNGTGALSSCSAAAIIDKVAWGSGDCPETATVLAHAAGESIERLTGGAGGNAVDTDDNNSDWFVQTTPNPQSDIVVSSCGGGLGNVGNTLVSDGSGGFVWGTAYGATAYPLRRGTTGNFMGTPPAPLTTPAGLTWTDVQDPASGECWYYNVRATDGVDESTN